MIDGSIPGLFLQPFYFADSDDHLDIYVLNACFCSFTETVASII